MKEKIQCIGAAAAGVVVMALVLVGGYQGVRFASRAVHMYDPCAKLEATKDATMPILRILGGQ
ncbi:MAG: hypothetical protein Q7R85_03365 [bacterium]|nr:hypothetical protein [bacterium]